MKKTRPDDARGVSHSYNFKFKPLTIMLAVLLFTVSSLQIQAKDSIGQEKISIEKEAVSIKLILKDIEKQSKLRFFYSTQVDVKRKVTLHVKDALVDDVIKEIFKDTPVHYKYSGRQILLYRPPNLTRSAMKSLDAGAEAEEVFTVTGVVTDDQGQPLPGVNVVEKGTTNGTATDSDGKYAMTVAEGNAVLVFSFIGYLTEERNVSDQSTLNITLYPDIQTLTEVVVVGYGTVKKNDLTGSVASVRSKDFENQPLTRVDQALQGNAPGVVVSSNGGQPGGGIKVRIRGANSITGSNDPLYVIDGFIGGDIASINPNDIESIEVLKDASATAIYGSRGANGVILITTKSGKTGGSQIDFSTFFTVNQLQRKLDLMNASEFAQTVNENSTTPPFSQADLDRFRTQSTDWQDEIYRNAWSKNYQLSVGGGNKDVRYFISANRSDQEGILVNSGYNRTTIRANIDASLTNRLSIKFNVSAANSNGHNNRYEGWKQQPQSQATIWDPTAPVYLPDGSYNLKSAYGSIWNQPLAVAEAAKADNTLNDYIGNLSATYEFVKDLKLTVRAAIEQQENLGRRFDTPEFTSGTTYNASFSTNRFRLFQNSNILSYTKTIADHSLNVVAIYEQQSRVSDNIYGGSTSLITGSTGYYNLGLGTASLGSGYYDESIQSYLGRVNYSYKDRYLVTASYRSDGSSKFAKGNQYSGFPSVALAWKVSEESFLSNASFLSDLKLRLSYGKTGNQAIAPYSTLTLLNTGAYYTWDGSGRTPGISIGSPANKDLKWETTSSFNAGVDVGLFSGKLNLTVDFYKKTTDDLLLAVPLPQYLGGGTYLKNIGSVENKGVELILSGTPVSVGSFKWNSTFNITTNKNKVLDLGYDPSGTEETKVIYTGTNTFNGNNPTYVIQKGESLGQMWGFQSLGTWKNSEAAQASAYGANPGEEKFLDVNGDGIISGEDQVVVGNSTPKFTFGFNNDFTYKNFSLNVFFFGIQGFDLWNVNKAYAMGNQSDARNSTDRDYLDRWRPDHETETPTNNTTVQSSRYVEDGSFIKLKNINLTYRLPQSVLGRAKIRSLDVYVAGQNLFMITKYKGYDPEATSTFAGGGGDAIGAIDWGSTPNPRSYTVGVRVGL